MASFCILVFVSIIIYSSSCQPKDGLYGVAARWDARQRVGGGCQGKSGKTKGGKRKMRDGWAVRRGEQRKIRGRVKRTEGDLSGRQAILPLLEDSGMTMMSVLTLHYLVFLSSHR